MKTPNNAHLISKIPERALLTLLSLTGLGSLAIANAYPASADTTNPGHTLTIGRTIKGSVSEIWGNMPFNYEQVQYFPDGSRKISFGLSKKDVSEDLTVDEFDEDCFSDSDSSAMNGHDLAINDSDTHIVAVDLNSPACNTGKLTSKSFAHDPFALGASGYINYNK